MSENTALLGGESKGKVGPIERSIAWCNGSSYGSDYRAIDRLKSNQHFRASVSYSVCNASYFIFCHCTEGLPSFLVVVHKNVEYI